MSTVFLSGACPSSFGGVFYSKVGFESYLDVWHEVRVTMIITNFSKYCTNPYSYSLLLSICFLFLKAWKWNPTWSTRAVWHMYLSFDAWWLSVGECHQRVLNLKISCIIMSLCTLVHAHPLTFLPTHRQVRHLSILSLHLPLAVLRLELLACSRSQRHGSELHIHFLTCCSKGEDDVNLVQTSPRTEVSTCTNKSATKWTMALAITT